MGSESNRSLGGLALLCALGLLALPCGTAAKEGKEEAKRASHATVGVVEKGNLPAAPTAGAAAELPGPPAALAAPAEAGLAASPAATASPQPIAASPAATVMPKPIAASPAATASPQPIAASPAATVIPKPIDTPPASTASASDSLMFDDELDDLILSPEPYYYQGLGRRDIFVSLVSEEYREEHPAGTPVSSQMHVLGILWGEKDRFALVETDDGQSMILREGDPVGDGTVLQIHPNRVVIHVTEYGTSRHVSLPLEQGGNDNGRSRIR